MSQYTAVIREHVTTGNAMLALSDSDMDKKLGLATVLHRRKLRLAIEEQRRPDRWVWLGLVGVASPVPNTCCPGT